MTEEQIKDIIEWDIVNWSKSIPFWEKHAELNNNKLKCLELGGRRGGLSLWLALKGHDVICSDLNSPIEEAQPKHKHYGLSNNIDYQSIDASKIPFNNELDVVAFKTIIPLAVGDL